MSGLAGLSHHRHTGRLRPHNETSFAALVFVLLCLGLVMVAAATQADAATTTGGGAYAVTGVVAGPKPTLPATITSPSNGQVFQTNPLQVTGTCPSNSLVKVFSNGVLVGSAICGSDRHFTLQIQLLVGQNQLTALPYNTNDEAGPASAPVTVTLNAPPGGPGFSTELVLQSINYYRGSIPGQEVTWPITIVGGVAPYAVNFDWGDGTSDLVTRTTAGPFTLSHTYKKAGGYLGSYPLIIRATDAAGHTGYLQLTTIVNDATGANSTGKVTTKTAISFVLIWPIWVVLILMVISFWLGERREKRIMKRKLALA
jgi:hypothetical protein